MNRGMLAFLASSILAAPASAATLNEAIRADLPLLMNVYRDMHANPELSSGRQSQSMVQHWVLSQALGHSRIQGLLATGSPRVSTLEPPASPAAPSGPVGASTVTLASALLPPLPPEPPVPAAAATAAAGAATRAAGARRCRCCPPCWRRSRPCCRRCHQSRCYSRRCRPCWSCPPCRRRCRRCRRARPSHRHRCRRCARRWCRPRFRGCSRGDSGRGPGRR